MSIGPRVGPTEVLASRLRLVGHPLRLALLGLLARRPGMCVCAMAGALRVDQPAVSHHLGALRNAGLVVSHRKGPRVEYRIRERNAGAVLRSLADVLSTAGTPSEDQR